jgi:hypothetical protein
VMLEHKAALSARRVVKIDQWYPSSQLCSVAACGPDVRPPARVAAGVEAGTALAGATAAVRPGIPVLEGGEDVNPGRSGRASPGPWGRSRAGRRRAGAG